MRFKVLSNQKEKAQLADMASHVWLERKERKEGERRRRKKKKKKPAYKLRASANWKIPTDFNFLRIS